MESITEDPATTLDFVGIVRVRGVGWRTPAMQLEVSGPLALQITKACNGAAVVFTFLAPPGLVAALEGATCNV